jgi:hypothetical protein
MKKLKTIEKFNKISNKWLSELEKMGAEEILVIPKPNAWSFAEVYDHIIKVARTFQIPNFKKSVTPLAERKKRKNKIGFAVFNLKIRKHKKLKIQNFPNEFTRNFTPKKQTKADLIIDFKQFIKEVNDLEEILMNSSKKNKQYHPMFGNINTQEWFSLIELHMWHHDFQKNKINEYLRSQRLEKQE